MSNYNKNYRKRPNRKDSPLEGGRALKNFPVGNFSEGASLKGQGDVKSNPKHKNKIIPYNPKLKALSRQLRSNSTLSEILLWQKVKRKSLGYEFHRQVPIDEFIVDFYCHELNLAIEIDGNSHDYNYLNDNRRQVKLEKLGVNFIRFNDSDIKKSINDVLRAL